MKKVLLSIAALSLFVLPAYATHGIRENTKNEIRENAKNEIARGRNYKSKRNGIVKVKSNYSVDETVQRFQSIAKEQGLNIVAVVNHQAGAESVDLELRPTQVIIFGNPRAGTPLMQCNQTAGIDLPQKALIWEDEEGQVWLGYNSPRYLFIRHRLRGCGEEALERIGNALNMLAQKVTQ